jgi:hypothetical protein
MPLTPSGPANVTKLQISGVDAIDTSRNLNVSAATITASSSLIAASGEMRVTIGAAAGQHARLMFTTSAGTFRWTLGKNSSAESGANAGGDLVITRFDDSGASVGTSTFTRSTGAVSFENSVNASAGFLVGGSAVVDSNRGVRRRTYTFATLPSQPYGAGYMFEISDGAATPTWGAAAAGGGSTQTPVRSTGSAWVNG